MAELLYHRFMEAFRTVAYTNNTAFIESLVQALELDTIAGFVSLILPVVCADAGNFSMIKFWTNMTLPLGEYYVNADRIALVKHITRTANVECMRWLLSNEENVQVNEIQISSHVSKDRAFAFLTLLHDLNVGGTWKDSTCNIGKCSVCAIEKTWDAWVMEHQEFNSLIQWLPQEMVVDTVTLL